MFWCIQIIVFVHSYSFRFPFVLSVSLASSKSKVLFPEVCQSKQQRSARWAEGSHFVKAHMARVSTKAFQFFKEGKSKFQFQIGSSVQSEKGDQGRDSTSSSCNAQWLVQTHFTRWLGLVTASIRTCAVQFQHWRRFLPSLTAFQLSVTPNWCAGPSEGHKAVDVTWNRVSLHEAQMWAHVDPNVLSTGPPVDNGDRQLELLSTDESPWKPNFAEERNLDSLSSLSRQQCCTKLHLPKDKLWVWSTSCYDLSDLETIFKKTKNHLLVNLSRMLKTHNKNIQLLSDERRRPSLPVQTSFICLTFWDKVNLNVWLLGAITSCCKKTETKGRLTHKRKTHARVCSL